MLKQYVIQGYAINGKRLQAFERTVGIQTKMLVCTLEVEESEILKAVSSYTDALMLLDQYDHQSARRKDKNLRTLMKYASMFHVEKILRPYLEVLL